LKELQYPADAEKVIASLQHGLNYDAAVAIMGNACALLPANDGVPNLSTGFRIGGLEFDEAVRREASGLLSRFALISMVSRIDVCAQSLLLQRRVIEHCRTPGVQISGTAFWTILKRVRRESRGGPVKLCSELVVEHPSTELQQRMKWLAGLVSIRNCLTHRLGSVQLDDVALPGTPLEDVQETDRLRAIFLHPKMFINDIEITTFPHQHGEGEGIVSVRFQESEREWKIGDQIHLTPSECQDLAVSLSFLGIQLLADLKTEMGAIIGSPGSS
jgi:hypothetical protein